LQCGPIFRELVQGGGIRTEAAALIDAGTVAGGMRAAGGLRAAAAQALQVAKDSHTLPADLIRVEAEAFHHRG